MALKHNWRGGHPLYWLVGWYSPWWIMIISNIQRVVQLYNPITHQRIISHYDPMMFQRWPLWRFPEMRVPLNHPIFRLGFSMTLTQPAIGEFAHDFGNLHMPSISL